MVHDLCMWGNSYTLKVKHAGGPVQLWRLPPQHVGPKSRLAMRADSYQWRGATGARDFDAAEVMHVRNWNPDDPRVGVSPLGSLRRTFAEDVASGRYREHF
jgi:phage portal protein BeeE